MKRLIMFSVVSVVIAILSTACNCPWWSKDSGKCAMCQRKLHSEKCVETSCGKVDYPCASHCMMCKKCKLAITPEKAKECNYKCICGEKLVPMKDMSYQDMSGFSEEQAKCMRKCCICQKNVHKCCCMACQDGPIGNCCIMKCMICKKCNGIMTPAHAKACNNTCCGEKLVPVKDLSTEEFKKLRKEQVKRMQTETDAACKQ